MEDILLMQFLRKKGIISDKDMHEFHELAQVNTNKQQLYQSKAEIILAKNEIYHLSENEAKQIVSEMYHIDQGRKCVGEKFDMSIAEEIHNKYTHLIPQSVTALDIYVAINSQYHDYITLFKSWFTNNVDDKIIESAIIYWFADDDCKSENKILKYFKKV